MDRVHLYPTTISTVTYFNKTVTLKTPAIEELFGMKINALIDRSKPRDLYDSAFLVDNINFFDRDKLRKAVVFYLSLNNVFELNTSSLSRINTINWHNVKTELQPVLKKGEIFKLEEAKKITIDMLNELLVLTEQEKQYLVEFSKSDYNPSLLFDEPISSKVEEHPMAKWRIASIKK